jgi:hypothetical protein
VRALALALVVAIPAGAQQGPDSSRVLFGLIVDSVHGGPLRGATVRVGETGVTATTDSAGRYRLIGIPTGRHRVELLHPLLDTLRLAVRTNRREFGDTTALVIGTPSAATLVALKCTPEERARGDAMALGFVTVAGSEEPAHGAIVRVAWTDYEVAGKRLRSNDQVRTGIVGSDGSYKVCGIPSDLETGIHAMIGRDTTTSILTGFRKGLAIVSFRVAGEPAAVTTPGMPSMPVSTVRGRVSDSAGRPVAEARVASDDGLIVSVTQPDGTFQLSGMRPGTCGINVRRIGFLPVSRPVDVTPQGAALVDIRLSAYVPVLETVRISARRDFELERVGFASRSKSGAGRYIGPDEIERRNPHRLADLLRMMPMLRTYYGQGGDPVITGRRGECLRYYVDGIRWGEFGDTPDRFLIGREIGAIEAYSGMTAPAQFMAHQQGGQTCSVVVIWTTWKLRM